MDPAGPIPYRFEPRRAGRAGGRSAAGHRRADLHHRAVAIGSGQPAGPGDDRARAVAGGVAGRDRCRRRLAGRLGERRTAPADARAWSGRRAHRSRWTCRTGPTWSGWRSRCSPRSAPWPSPSTGEGAGERRASRVARDGAVARVTLDRPEVRNAFNAELIADLHDAFAALADEPPEALRAVVLAGEGAVVLRRRRRRLDARLGGAVGGGQRGRRAAAWPRCSTPSTRCPVPVIARVHGAALGGGMGLCAVADITLADAGRHLRLHRDASWASCRR